MLIWVRHYSFALITLVIMAGDNGMPFPRCKGTLYDLGTRVPLAIRWGSKVSGGRRISDFVSLTDLAPTILAAAGLGDDDAQAVVATLLGLGNATIEDGKLRLKTAGCE